MRFALSSGIPSPHSSNQQSIKRAWILSDYRMKGRAITVWNTPNKVKWCLARFDETHTFKSPKNRMFVWNLLSKYLSPSIGMALIVGFGSTEVWNAFQLFNWQMPRLVWLFDLTFVNWLTRFSHSHACRRNTLLSLLFSHQAAKQWLSWCGKFLSYDPPWSSLYPLYSTL